MEKNSSAGIITPPADPDKVRFKAGENINVIEIIFSNSIRREGLGGLNEPQSIHIDLFDDSGALHKMFGDIQIIDQSKVRFILKDPNLISQPGRYRLLVLGKDADAPAIRAVDDNSILNGDYDDQPDGNFQLLFIAE
jgi:hypothetical protein